MNKKKISNHHLDYKTNNITQKKSKTSNLNYAKLKSLTIVILIVFGVVFIPHYLGVCDIFDMEVDDTYETRGLFINYLLGMMQLCVIVIMFLALSLILFGLYSLYQHLIKKFL